MLIKELQIPELEDAPPSRRFWTDEEDTILRKYYGRTDPGKIAEYLKRSKRAVQNRASELGLTYQFRTLLP